MCLLNESSTSAAAAAPDVPSNDTTHDVSPTPMISKNNKNIYASQSTEASSDDDTYARRASNSSAYNEEEHQPTLNRPAMPRKSSITSVTSITSTASSGRRPRSRRSSMQRRRSSCDSLTLSINGLGNDNLSSSMLGVSISNISASLQDELENEEEEEEEEEEEVHPLPSFLKTKLPQLLTTKRPSCIRLDHLTKAEEEPSPTSTLTVLQDSVEVEETSETTTTKKTVKTSTTSQVFFMIGCQRSGSNWLRTMLSEREDLIAPHPPHIMRDFMPKLVKYGSLNDQKNLKVRLL